MALLKSPLIIVGRGRVHTDSSKDVLSTMVNGLCWFTTENAGTADKSTRSTMPYLWHSGTVLIGMHTVHQVCCACAESYHLEIENHGLGRRGFLGQFAAPFPV